MLGGEPDHGRPTQTFLVRDPQATTWTAVSLQTHRGLQLTTTGRRFDHLNRPVRIGRKDHQADRHDVTRLRLSAMANKMDSSTKMVGHSLVGTRILVVTPAFAVIFWIQQPTRIFHSDFLAASAGLGLLVQNDSQTHVSC